MQKALEPLQNLILRLAKVAAKATDEQLTEVNICLTDARKTDGEMRARLFVLQVARKYILPRLTRCPDAKRASTTTQIWPKFSKRTKKGRTS